MAKQPKYDGIRPDVKNANRGTERGRYMVEASLRETGAGRSILLDKDGRIIAGNKTFEAASDIGLPVRVVETDGTELVAVKRTDLDLDDDTGTARKLAYYDNRAAQVGLDWDAEQMLADLGAGLDLSAMFRQDELDELLADLQPKTTGDTPAETDRAEELRQKWGTAPGQLWQLGEHRLVCGDCTDAATVARVMGGDVAAMVWSDPPYGLGGYAGRSGKLDAVQGDDADDATVDAFFAVGDAPEVYICCEWKTYPHLLAARGEPRSLIVWAKQVFGMGRGYRRQHEFVGYYGKFDSTTESDLWHIDRGANYDHPTEKPADLPARAIANSSKAGDVIFDPFAGTAPSIIACENLGRRCRAIELDAKYVAVALERWAQHTGKAPVLIEGAA